MPRPRAKPEPDREVDRLVPEAEAARICGVSLKRWKRGYWLDWPALVAGMRPLPATDPKPQPKPGTKRGRGRPAGAPQRQWLQSALLEHIRVERRVGVAS